MYRTSLMALIAGDLPCVNRERCIKIAIVHDIAEAIVGDITPSCGVPKEEKSIREQAALIEMCRILGGGMRAEEIQELWAEYENTVSQLNEIGQKTTTGGWFISEEEAALLAYDDGSCFFHNITNCEVFFIASV